MNITVQQGRAITHPSNRILCIAGPGSGKTFTLVERIQVIIQKPGAAERMAVVTFTASAAREIQRRVSERHGAEVEIGYIGTLHGLCYRLLSRYGSRIGLGRRLSVVDEEQGQAMLERCAAELKWKGTYAKLMDAILKGPVQIARIPRMKRTPAEAVAAHYFRTLRAGNMATFDCLLAWTVELLAQNRNLDVGIDHLLVDEYQDSGPMDADIYALLSVKTRFWVGDCDQAIYGFRGATVENINFLAGDVQTQVCPLEANFRSDQAICRVAQRLIEHNVNRFAKETRSQSADQGEVLLVRHRDAHAELVWIANEAAKSDDCAVLLRTNRLVQDVTRYLVGMGIQVQTKERRDRPADWRKAKLLLSLLCNPDNDQLAGWFIEAFHGPAKAQKARIQAMADGQTLNEACLKVPADVSIDRVDELLGRCGISEASREMVAEALQGLPGEPGVADLLLALTEVENCSQEAGSGVVVTTMHGAKGREWDTVILPAFEQGVIPARRDLAEERRLAYVAFTRARHRLLIGWCERRKSPWSDVEETEPSQFIQEVGL